MGCSASMLLELRKERNLGVLKWEWGEGGRGSVEFVTELVEYIAFGRGGGEVR